MLANYFVVALRNLLKRKAYTAINILGLAVGLTACLLILLYVADERSYDKQWKNSERIYRMALIRKYPDRQTGYAIIPQSFAGAAQKDIPEVEEATRLLDFTGNATLLVKRDQDVFEEKLIFSADSNFFRVFSIPLLKGDPEKCLAEPHSLVLTETSAKRYFGSAEKAFGQTLFFPDGGPPQPKKVTAVCADMQGNTHFSFNILESSTGFEFLAQPNYIGFSSATYLLLRPGADPKAVESKFPMLVERYAAGQVQRNFGVDYAQYTAAGNGWRYFLQALPDIHLDSALDYELQPNGSRRVVTIFSVIAAFILLLAGINFVNLTTARSGERAREVGIRKAVGAERGQLAGQFLAEAVVVSLTAAVLSAGFAALLLPAFNRIADKHIEWGQYAGWPQAAAFLAFAVATGLLAGAYPAGVLSGFRPAAVLKGKFSNYGKGLSLRNSLVVLQFAVSIVLIVSTIVVANQLNFIFDKNLGFDRDHIFSIQNAFVLQGKTEAFKQEISALPGVESVGGTSENPGGPNFFGASLRISGNPESVTGRGMTVDEAYVETMKMQMLAGRSFSKNFNDSLSVLLNERAARDLGFQDPESIIGRQVAMPNALFPGIEGDLLFTVRGVLRDFHFQSLHEAIVPLFVLNDRLQRGIHAYINVRVKAEQAAAFAARAETVWRQFSPEQPFRYTLLDEDLAALYRNEQRARRLFNLFAFLAIFIACIGLTALATYATQQRAKEIGIRKALGASVAGVTGLLAKDFLKLVLVALLLATPLAWYLMDRWLSDFAYRIAVQWWMFAAAGLIALLIALFTVGFQSLKAAMVNPIKSLRSE